MYIGELGIIVLRTYPFLLSSVLLVFRILRDLMTDTCFLDKMQRTLSLKFSSHHQTSVAAFSLKLLCFMQLGSVFDHQY